MRFLKILALLFFILAMFYLYNHKIKKQTVTEEISSDEAFERKLQEQFILIEDGGVIEIPEGSFSFSKSLSLEGKKNITIKGAGQEKTLLSFVNQTEGAEGINITNCDGITLEHFTIQDSKGDNIKLKDCNRVILRNLNSTWTNGADSTNGSYGYYPVLCTNVLIENCEVSYSADAGVYVGQSTNVIVRNCYAHHNVAGIEIENCINSDVYDNVAENNAGGILVFDLPKLFQSNGRNARLFNNKCINNNFKNFAKPGAIVGTIPSGTGIIIMATDSVDVYNNTIQDNKTVGVAIVSYHITGKPVNDTAYGPYSYAISVHDNQFARKAILIPDLKNDLGKLLLATAKSSVDIVYDGASDPSVRGKNGSLPEDKKICIRNNGDNIKFMNLNAWKADGIVDLIKYYDTDMNKFNCDILGILGNDTPTN